jgi:hypothetical protein
VVCADGWPWTERERTSPEHRIIRVKGLTADEVSSLIMPQRVHPDFYVPARRSFRVDHLLLPPGARGAYLSVVGRHGAFIDLTREELLAALVDEPLHERPDVLGQGPIL